ncbi:hypothetical protein ACLBYG_21970 [Methylobacterium sp. D53M]
MNAPSTLNDFRPAADICRERGWFAGTKLIGDAGFGPIMIEVTKLGERVMLAKVVSINGEPPSYGNDRAWTLGHRDWREVRS